ncbi:rhomboid family intramembrane serine protease [Williamsia deligens]|uniref:Rhomboid family intramembrane serine protease n=1 Tax=Williamsia deligens TaxID=321325 RepID=A0ABW3G937_9NOCA|nr:rhomboid family intramembrane serine protease [Williamsia deligens]
MCARHPDRPTGLSCTRCGRPACPECLTPAAVGQHCVDCVRQARGSTPRAVTIGTTRPRATYALIAVNVVVFVLTALQAHGVGNVGPGDSRAFYDGVLFGPFVGQGEVWRIVTSGFLHYSLIHIGLNMLTLYILGRDLESALGTARFVGVYAVALLGGSAAVLTFSPMAAAAGASGAIYGVMGGLLVAVIRAKIPPGQIIGLIVINIVISVTIPNISLWAHLGGLVFGAAATAGILLLPGLVLGARNRTARTVSRVGWASVGTLAVLAIAISLLVSG